MDALQKFIHMDEQWMWRWYKDLFHLLRGPAAKLEYWITRANQREAPPTFVSRCWAFDYRPFQELLSGPWLKRSDDPDGVLFDALRLYSSVLCDLRQSPFELDVVPATKTLFWLKLSEIDWIKAMPVTVLVEGRDADRLTVGPARLRSCFDENYGARGA